MTTLARAFKGTGYGILSAFPALAAVLPFRYQPRNAWEWALMVLVMGFAFFPLALLAAPGAFALSCLHAVQMERWAPRARNLGQIRRVGVLLGLPLGVANLILIFAVGYLLNGKSPIWRTDMLPWLIPAVVGGAGLGWGVTLGLRPGNERPEPTRIVRPTRPPALKRDAPPFFDNRPARMIRRRSLHEVTR